MTLLEAVGKLRSPLAPPPTLHTLLALPRQEDGLRARGSIPCSELKIQEDLEEEEEVGEEDDEDVNCDVCKNGDTPEDDMIVICEGCSVAVHQSCYGLKEIPEGDWFCGVCEEELEQQSQNRDLDERSNMEVEQVSFECFLCGQSGGAMRPTQDKKAWAHVSCVWWDPDVIFDDATAMQPVTFCRPIPQSRRAACSVCRKSRGAVISCRWAKGCTRVFHARCAHQGQGFLRMAVELGGLVTECYCDKHKDERWVQPLVAVGSTISY